MCSWLAAASECPRAAEPLEHSQILPCTQEDVAQDPALSPAEVAAAVRDLLVAARMPLDLDRERLIQDTLALREELKSAQDAAAAATSVCPLACQ